jgi:type II secretion system protein G
MGADLKGGDTMRRNAKGFTLIELLIVVAIIGIIAAIAIPNLLNAIDRGKQKRTMADLRSIGTSVEAYAVDNNIYPTAANMGALEPVLEPIYIKNVPTNDGWNNAMVYQPGASSGQGYTTYSTGKDGAAEGSPAGGMTNDFDCDILFIDGQFVQWPEGMQQ